GDSGDERVHDAGLEMAEILERGIASATTPGKMWPLAGVELLPPVPRPGKLLAVAANYQDHIRESGLPPVDKSKRVPRLFLKPTTSLLAPGAALKLPAVSHTVDWELELAVVIGRSASFVTVGSALRHVAGYAIINDVSARSLDWDVARDDDPWNGFFDWLNGKWLDGFAPMGPWLRTADEVPDPQDLWLTLRVNGAERQHARTSDMIFSVAELVAFASRLMTLHPGDVIATGTPAGVGAATQTYLNAGDLVEGTIDGLGTLVTPVVRGDDHPGGVLSTMYNSGDAGNRG
ncbi:MAG TPA: fumarylacetoacetate hydrolase family protein, partial [Candidatus Dormibacteraeota bacterium]|nr:fumarylacetoacetate hydrolase family protein [Candidatus Dormibacteraeota bacterium]